jgi:hypothetical protein
MRLNWGQQVFVSAHEKSIENQKTKYALPVACLDKPLNIIMILQSMYGANLTGTGKIFR